MDCTWALGRAPSVAERVKHVVAGAVQRQAVAGAEQAPHRRGALIVDHLLDVQFHLSQKRSARMHVWLGGMLEPRHCRAQATRVPPSYASSTAAVVSSAIAMSSRR